eukprot:COSAG01_NODE_3_length_63519_cov_1591.007663_15_plen_1265_part_00
MKYKKFLFEVSWEVCNQVGGIYTVLKTKASQALKAHGEDYICVGPLLDEASEFIDSSHDVFWDPYKVILDELGCDYRLGYWQIEGEPKVILLSYEDYPNQGDLLHQYWKRYHLDTYGAGYDIVHPILFSTRVADFLDAFSCHYLKKRMVMAHFHEWMTGLGILHLNAKSSAISTVFTTHATVLGRAYSGSFSKLDYASFSPTDMASQLGVSIKHQIESLSALQADCFTCVSDAVAEECRLLLGVSPQVVVKNGVNIDWFRKLRLSAAKKKKHKRQLIKDFSNLFSQDFAANTQLWVSAGRFEYHNKGFDVLLDSLEALNAFLLDRDADPVIMLITPAVVSKGLTQSLQQYTSQGRVIADKAKSVLVTHTFLPFEEDVLLQKLSRTGFANSDNSKVYVVYSPQLLQGQDGFYQCTYYELLAAMDLSIFPSLYEPWGYTPQESLALGVPTLASDSSGFVQWAMQFEGNQSLGVITRSRDCYQTALVSLSQQMEHFYFTLGEKKTAVLLKDSDAIAASSDWESFYLSYQQAYEHANALSVLRTSCSNAIKAGKMSLSSIKEQQVTQLQGLKTFTKRLQRWLGNWWWAYDSHLADFFAILQPKLWQHVHQDPLAFFKVMDPALLQEKLKSIVTQDQLQSLQQAFDSQCVFDEAKIPKGMSVSSPIAYFSMEFGIHASLPIYSGGLGVLAGDILKSASDMHLPMLGVGLMYRAGYFNQGIAEDGAQRMSGSYLSDQNLLDLELKPLFSEAELLKVSLFEKDVYLQCWVLQLGRSTLYLLDSDVEKNDIQDRHITHQLYPSSRLLRLKQEVILGFAGVLLLKRLGVQPSVYHMNEGHSAFLVLQRLCMLRKAGLTTMDAISQIKQNTCFTTHTSVPAGLESFDPVVVQQILQAYWEPMGIAFEDCLSWASQHGEQVFSLALLAFRFSSVSNAVSRLHAKLANQLWKGLFPSASKSTILSVTNAVHAATWIGEDMKLLYQGLYDDAVRVPQLVSGLSLNDVWQAHTDQKQRFLRALAERVQNEYSSRYANYEHIYDLMSSLSQHPEWLTIGFARRFATYKQADLILENPLWLKRLLVKGVRLIFAGKAHPADTQGQAVLQKIYHLSQQEGFKGHIYVLENYDMTLAAKMVQGVDVWLNNPVFGQEASGTSGMKAALNGVLNLSVADGWWHEAYDKRVGWCVHSEASYPDASLLRRQYATHLYTLLEKEIIPLYYKGLSKKGYSEEWVRKMKYSMSVLSKHFSGQRMMQDYYKSVYKLCLQQHVKQSKKVVL